MTDPLKVTLPPWRRGDGQPCKEPGWYAVRMNHPSGDGISEWCYKSTDDLLHSTNEYIGPVEYVVTEPEPEPLTLLGHGRVVCQHAGRTTVQLEPLVGGTGLAVRLQVSHEDRRTAIERFNAAVRAMEGPNGS